MNMKCNIEATRVPQSDSAVTWAAGFFEGDGCTSISKQQVSGRKNLTYRLRLLLLRNCKETLIHFERVVGERAFITTPGQRLEHNKQTFMLVYEGRHALAALQKLTASSCSQKDRALAAMRFWQEGRMGTLPGHKGFAGSVHATTPISLQSHCAPKRATSQMSVHQR